MKYCPKCGNALDDQDMFCKYCGTPQGGEHRFGKLWQTKSQTGKKRNNALLAIMAVVMGIYVLSQAYVITPEKHTFSNLFTDEQIHEIRKQLMIPDDLSVEVSVGQEYLWEGANLRVAPVDFYYNGEYCAGADCEVGTSNIATSIYSYSH